MRLPTICNTLRMAKSQLKVVEGVFAINKPPDISSAQVIRNLQQHFNPSTLFAPWLAAERASRNAESRPQQRRRRDKRLQVKIGHGGTLDPMATGVLIMGVGKGTKYLQNFLECTKSYEATILFGGATDTYDTLGKVLRRAEYGHVTRETVKKALGSFTGKIMQRPPIYSALRVQGKRLYEYAREGKEVPTEIMERPVEVKKLQIVEWLDGGSHQYNLPEEEAEVEAKEVANKVLHLDYVVAGASIIDGTEDVNGTKRKRELAGFGDSVVSNKRPALEQEDASSPQMLMSGGLQIPELDSSKSPEPTLPTSADHDCRPLLQESLPSLDKGPPAVKLRMTVTSGFYVRSLSHDLGEAVGSLACMSALVRTRQGDFELGKNVLEYEVLERGEDVWAPQIQKLLDQWDQKAP
ncbi:hypothetical protein N7G274_000012 [Stereocaulon virgatum]|uniref:tRNA pseudouridine(55) synthase n=1 Tax=Stereocaulon virgatum TaxID=373712 RepID=A0ABR4ARA3_9LECA